MKKGIKFTVAQRNPCMCKIYSQSLIFLNDYIDNSKYPLRTRLKLGIKKCLMALVSAGNLNVYKYLGASVAIHGKVYKSEIIFKGKKIVRCNECNLTWLHPMPSNDELVKYYSGSFWKNKNATFQLSAGSTNEKNRAYYQYDFMKPFIDFSNEIKATLEIGAGNAGIT